MSGKRKFPEGTVFSGESAFVPVPESEGGGFRVVKVDEYDCPDLLSDNLGAAEDTLNSESENYVSEIKFDVDYKTISKPGRVSKAGKAHTKTATNKSVGDKTGEPDKKFNDDNDPYVRVARRNRFSEEDIKSVLTEKSHDKKEDDKSGENFETDVTSNVHAGHRGRLKERFDKLGLEGFAQHEVLEFLLYFTISRRNTNPIAHALIKEFGDISKVFKADRKFLEDVDGVGKESSLLIHFCHQLMLYLNSRVPKSICLANSTDMGEFCTQFFLGRTEETFAVLILDTKRNLQNVIIISEGTENDTAYYPRNVVKEVIKHKANVAAIAHNHTGSCVHPSDNDIAITDSIYDLLNGIGVPLIDHIVCCDGKFTSFADRGFMPFDRRARL